MADLEADVEAPEEWEVLMRDLTLEEKALTSEVEGMQQQQTGEERGDGEEDGQLQEETPAKVLTLADFARVLETKWPDRSLDAIPDDEVGALLKQFSRGRGAEDLDRETTRVDTLGDLHTTDGAPKGISDSASQPVNIVKQFARQPNGMARSDSIHEDADPGADGDADADLLSPRSATPVSNEQFALAAGLGHMDSRSQGRGL